jgi:hypothetical protein
LIGIESPGLTCCLSIAKYVKEIINKWIFWLQAVQDILEVN